MPNDYLISTTVYNTKKHLMIIHIQCESFFYFQNRVSGVMVGVLTSNKVVPWFEARSGQTKDYKIGIFWFSSKHAELRRKSKDWNQDNVSEWSDMSIRRMLFQ